MWHLWCHGSLFVSFFVWKFRVNKLCGTLITLRLGPSLHTTVTSTPSCLLPSLGLLLDSKRYDCRQSGALLSKSNPLTQQHHFYLKFPMLNEKTKWQIILMHTLCIHNIKNICSFHDIDWPGESRLKLWSLIDVTFSVNLLQSVWMKGWRQVKGLLILETIESWIVYVCHSEGEWARQKI